MRQVFGVFLIFLSLSGGLKGQLPFQVELEEVSYPNFPGVHSGAFTVHDSLWVFIGGRTNGLHGFLPPLAFPSYGIPREIWVMSPASGQFWSQRLDSLDPGIREAVTSANLQFCRQDSFLYLVGGYGWNDSAAAFQTFPTLTAINLNRAVPTVLNGGDPRPAFRQITDQRLAVCGAHLVKEDSAFALVFGHQFDGMYDEVDSTGFFVQNYTYGVRRFSIYDDGDSLGIGDYRASIDSLHFRRRDYNLVPQIFPNGDFGHTAFSGVFQPQIDLPWLNSVDILPGNYTVDTSFAQLFSHYHSAVMPVYEGGSNSMHTVFFGGMAQFYIDSVTGFTQEDSLVPFVSTISVVSRDGSGNLVEQVFPDRMPRLLGTNAYFIPLERISRLHDQIIELDSIRGRTLVGHIIGGIESPDPNISDTDPSISWATNRIFEVYLNDPLLGNTPNSPSNSEMEIFPNPFSEALNIRLNLKNDQELSFSIHDLRGKTILHEVQSGKQGNNFIRIRTEEVPPGYYLLRKRSGGENQIFRVIKR